ncbi:MAG: RNase H family protein [Propionibacterium sp.]
MITAAADGSSLSNPGPAGWAWYIDDEHWASGGWPHGTNNMGELMAVLDLLRSTAVDADQPLHILCDSQYVINSVTKWMPGWKRKGWVKRDGKPVLNVELIKAIDEAIQGREISFEWVKGHAGHRLNEAADTRAHGAALAFQRGDKPDSGPGYRGAQAEGPSSTADAVSPADGVTSVAAGRSGPAAPGTSARQAAAAPGSRGGSVDRGAAAPGAQDGLFDVAAQPVSAGSGARPGATTPSGADPDLDEVVASERLLLTDRVRADPAKLRVLLHPDFVEYAVGGRMWTRSRLIAELKPLADSPRLEVLGSRRLGPDSLLLRWRSTSASATSLRSSVWVRDDALGRPRWRLLFSQGTAQPA